jgi:2-methylcitrate dehydratase PrpD
VPDINFKPYPANHFTHAGIDAALALRRRGVRPDDITSLVLGVSAPVLHTIGAPIEIKRQPETGYQAQFSGPFTVAAALIGGHGLGLGLDDFTDELAREPRRRALAAMVDVVEDPACTEAFPRQFAAVLTATLAGGDTVSERVMVNRGGPRRPLSDEELTAKFADNVKYLLDEPAATAIRHAVWSLGDPGGSDTDGGDTEDSGDPGGSAVGAFLEPLARGTTRTQ